MYYIIYISGGTNWFNETELKNILTISNINNSRNNITGVLLYGGGNFIQLLEGEKNAVLETFDRISTDQRHKGITTIASGELEERNFPHWAIGFKSIDSFSLTELGGYLDPTNPDFPSNKERRHIAIDLLKAFVRTSRIAG